MPSKKKDFFRRIDGPLSSVLCNCLQLPCLFPERSTFCEHRGCSRSSDWMRSLLETNPSVSLRDLVLPGTHDSASGTISFWKPFAAAGRTQNRSLYEQLELGARYVDVRVAEASAKGALSIWHGCLEGGDFEESIQEIKDFLRDHSSELVVLELVPEHGKPFSNSSKLESFRVVKNILGNLMLPANDVQEILNQPITWMKDRPERVIVLAHNRFLEGDGFKDSHLADFGFVKDGIINPWNNVHGDTPALLAKNQASVEKFQKYRTRVMCNQFFATPGVEGLADILGLLHGGNSLRPVSHACQLYEPGVLDQFLQEHADLPWNIVSLDFIELCPDIVDCLVSLNFRGALQIHLAVLERPGGPHRDVTQVVRASLCRQSFLFLVRPRETLDATDDCELTIAYTMQDDGANDECFVTTFRVGHENEAIVLSPFTNEGHSSHVKVDKGTQGYVVGGEIIKDAPTANETMYVDFVAEVPNVSLKTA